MTSVSRTTAPKVLLLAAVLLTAASYARAAGQNQNEGPEAGHLDVALSYQATYSNIVGAGGNFWLQGGDFQAHGQFWRGLGAVADVSGAHNANIGSTGVGLDLVTATFGPRYTLWMRRKPLSVYGHALVGEAFGMNSIFPGTGSASDSANSLAVVLGGGVNYGFRRFSLRALEADWVRTQLPNAGTNVQNNLRLEAGLVLHLK